ncbi:SDR family NAD(P)-dependent oxidoreductase [Yinghuangia aomiensis]
MELRFDGRVAVVTGAGRGLGRAYAHLLAARGASVVVNDLGVTTQGAPSHEDRAGTVAAEITAAGGDAVPNRDTVATPEGGQALIGTALDAYGRIDILVNNAGPQGGGLFDTVTDEQIDTPLRPHLHGAFHVTRPAWRAMCEQGYGRVVMTSSQAVLGIPGSGPYSAAKGGIVGLTNTLALEGARHGIRVNAVLPTAGTPATPEYATRSSAPGSHRCARNTSPPWWHSSPTRAARGTAKRSSPAAAGCPACSSPPPAGSSTTTPPRRTSQRRWKPSRTRPDTRYRAVRWTTCRCGPNTSHGPTRTRR